MDRPLKALSWRHQQSGALAGIGGLLVICAFLPLAALIAEAFSGAPQALAVLSRSRPFVLLLRSLGLATVVTVVAVAAGTVLAVLVARSDAAGRRLAALLHAFPMFIPPFLVGLGWFHVLGVRGVLGSEATSRLLFSEMGAVLILAMTFTPIATGLVALALRSVDPSLEEAARVVAPPRRVVARILLPAAAPALALAAILIFALSLSELGVPMLLRVEVFPTAVFARLGGIDYAPGEAVALVLPLLPVGLALLALERRFVGARSFDVLGLRSSQPEPIPLGPWRWAASLLLWTFAALSVAPIAALVWRAARGGGFAEVGRWAGRAPLNSLWTAAAAATVIVVIGLVLGHALARRAPGAIGLDAVSILAFVTPAAVLGMGLVAVWNRPALQWVYGTAAILIVGYVAKYAAVGVRTLAILVAQTPPHLEEAAATAGAGYFRRLTRIIAPLHTRGIGFAWLISLVFCLRDLELPVFYYPAGGEPATVRIFTLEANGPEPVVAALAVAHVAMTAAVLAGGALVLRART